MSSTYCDTANQILPNYKCNPVYEREQGGQDADASIWYNGICWAPTKLASALGVNVDKVEEKIKQLEEDKRGATMSTGKLLPTKEEAQAYISKNNLLINPPKLNEKGEVVKARKQRSKGWKAVTPVQATALDGKAIVFKNRAECAKFLGRTEDTMRLALRSGKKCGGYKIEYVKGESE